MEIDFMETIRNSFKGYNHKDDPVSKIELLKTLDNVVTHKTFVNDDKLNVNTMSVFQGKLMDNNDIKINKNDIVYKNVPEYIRITTICCLVCRQIIGRKKSIFTVEMYISEISYIGNEIFRRNFYLAGTLYKTYYVEDIFKIMTDAVPKWPNRKNCIYPSFDIFPSENTKESSSPIPNENNDDSIVDFINGEDKKKKKKKKKNKIQPNVPVTDSFDSNAASDFLRSRWIEAI